MSPARLGPANAVAEPQREAPVRTEGQRPADRHQHRGHEQERRRWTRVAAAMSVAISEASRGNSAAVGAPGRMSTRNSTSDGTV